MREVLQQALQRLADMASALPAATLHPHAISNMANALARADVRHIRLLEKLGVCVQNIKPTIWDMQSICSLVNAFVRCRYTDDGVMGAIDRVVCSIPRYRFSTQGVALVANAMSKSDPYQGSTVMWVSVTYICTNVCVVCRVSCVFCVCVSLSS